MSIQSESVRGRRRIVVISDLHMGVAERKIFSATEALTKFIEHVTDEHDARGVSPVVPVDLVILGDGVDFLQFANALEFSAEIALKKIHSIIETHASVFTSLARFLSQPHRTLRWFIGNHDLELHFAVVQQAIENTLKIDKTHANFRWHLDGADFDYVMPNSARVRLIHGNGPDPWNAIDYAQAQTRAAGDLEAPFAYCPGSRLVAEVLNPLADRGFFHVNLLKPEQSVALPLTFALWPDDTRQLLQRAFPLLEAANHRSLKEHVRDWFANKSDSPVRTAETLIVDLLATVADDVEDHVLEYLDELVTHSPSATALLALFTGKPEERRVEEKAKKLATRLLERAAQEANKQSDPWAIDQPDDLWPDVQRTFAGENPDNIAVLIAGHTHLARAMQLPAGYYINTGTWANLMRLPRELNTLAFDAWAGSLRDFFEHPDSAPWALRPFTRLTYADVLLNTENPTYSAKLCEWPSPSTRVLMSFP